MATRTTGSDISRYNRQEKDSRYTRMPWGRYRGFFIKDVPRDYLEWAILNYTDQAMAGFLAEELVRRDPEFRRKK